MARLKNFKKAHQNERSNFSNQNCTPFDQRKTS